MTDSQLRQLVRNRSDGVCEYCHFPEEHSFYPFQVDHIISQKHDGPTAESNLAWSCFYCNSFKGPNIAGWLKEPDTIVRLFHPRRDCWGDHFVWNGPLLVSDTDIATATINVLCINDTDAIAVRRQLFALGD